VISVCDVGRFSAGARNDPVDGFPKCIEDPHGPQIYVSNGTPPLLVESLAIKSAYSRQIREDANL
jgi:hypothetical protein